MHMHCKRLKIKLDKGQYQNDPKWGRAGNYRQLAMSFWASISYFKHRDIYE